MSEQPNQFPGQSEQPSRLWRIWENFQFWLRSAEKHDMTLLQWQLHELHVSASDIPRPEILDPNSAVAEAQRIIQESAGGQDTQV